MKIRKVGHSCLIVEVDGIRIMTDPGVLSTGQNDARDIDAVVITHQHPDHVDPTSLKSVLANNSNARVVSNAATAALLKGERIACDVVEDGDGTAVRGVTVQGYGNDHQATFPGAIPVQNTGYLIDGRLYHPGDALFVPPRDVEILAAPVAAPWANIAESIAYVIAVQPKFALPIHDGTLAIPYTWHSVPQEVLAREGIEFRAMVPNDEREF